MAKLVKTFVMGETLTKELVLTPIILNLEHVVHVTPTKYLNRECCWVELDTKVPIRIDMTFDKFAEIVNCFDAILTGEE